MYYSARLAGQHVLEQAVMVSTVSSGSLYAGQIYTKSDLNWPCLQHLLAKPDLGLDLFGT